MMEGAAEPVAMDRAHQALIFATALAQKPLDVIEFGVGSGATSEALIAAINYNQHGRLTCVDNWIDWGGAEPPVAERLRQSGVTVVCESERAFTVAAPANAYDLLVSDADHNSAGGWIADTFRIVRSGGILFFHDAAATNYAAMAKIREFTKSFPHQMFERSSRPDERCGRGLLMVWKP